MKEITGETKLLVFLLIVPLAFDFFGKEEGGNLFQYAIAGLTIFSFLVLLFQQLASRSGNYLVKREATIFNLVTLFMAGTIFSALINSVPFGRYLRVSIPYYLFCAGFIAVYQLTKKGYSLNYLYKILYVSLIISSCWTFAYALLILHIELREARFQILASTTPHLLGIVLFRVLHNRKLKSFEFLLLISLLSLILLSVTRSYILVFALICFAYFFLMSENILKFFVQAIFAVVAIAFIFTVSIEATRMLDSNVVARWTERSLDSKTYKNRDVTYVTRLAEYTSQYKLLTESPVTVLIGKGFGSSYTWDESYFDELAQVFPLSELNNLESWFGGHSFWVYTVYSCGVLFGLPFLFLYLYPIVRAYKLIKYSYVILKKSIPIYYFYAFFGLIGVTGASFTSNPLFPRYSALITGVFVATLAFRMNPDKLNQDAAHSGLHPWMPFDP